MAKRSPILGYNHNVRYRGLVFHVQTEDSGVLSPHLFTHLFYTGVIVSTRKLVYDSGSAEDAIKSLMQAQHKAVMKDLRRGVFDDKIDAYLTGTPGLLPRGEDRASEPGLARASEPDLSDKTIQTSSAAVSDQTTAYSDQTIRVPQVDDTRTRPDVKPVTPQPTQPYVSRSKTADRGSAPSSVRSSLSDPPPPPASDDIDGPTDLERGGVAAAAHPTLRTPRIELDQDDRFNDSQPEIEIQLELDEPEELPAGRRRMPRDTDVAGQRAGSHPAHDEHTRPTLDVSQLSDGIPGLAAATNTPRPGDSVPPLPAVLSNARQPSVGASALPPARPITRPPQRPAITPPHVMARPVVDQRGRESDAAEVFAPAPPSAEVPPGLRGGADPDRPAGTYAQHRRSSKVPVLADPPPRPASSSQPIPSGLARPRQASSQPATVPRRDSQSVPTARDSQPVPTVRPPDPTTPGAGPRPRTPTPARTSNSSAQPAQSRTGSPSGGVVMTRPAVIVGAPTKPTQPRVRKAREEEGRGFGQGLISEKSLDEVILAYLSEDADESK